MSIIWVVLANKSDVKIFEASSPKREMHRAVAIEHSVSEVKHAVASEEDPLVHAAGVFAKEISETLVREHSKGRYDDLVLVAEPAFMGKLMVALPRKFCQQHLAATVPKEFTHMTDEEIVVRLRTTVGVLWKDPRRWVPSGFAA